MNRIRFLQRITLLAPVALFTSSCDTLQDSVAPAASIMGARELTPGTHVVDLAAAGHDWKYTIHVPGHPRLDPAAPLVIVLHGSGEDGYTHLVLNGWIEKSESAGFCVAAPDGLALDPDRPANLLANPTFWNAEQPYLTDRRRAIDDLAFFDALLDDIAARTPIDSKRIFVTGHSGGAGMAFRLAAQRSERFAGMAAVASPCWQNDPSPAKAVPSLFIVGTLDPIVPSGGGKALFSIGSDHWSDCFPRRADPKLTQEKGRARFGVAAFSAPPVRRGGIGPGYFLTSVYLNALPALTWMGWRSC